MIVLDASAAIELILGSTTGQEIARRVLRETSTLHAPEVIDLEVVQVLRRYHRQKELIDSRLDAAFADFCALRLRRYPHRVLLPRVWALRHNVSAYDAAYLSLAETLEIPLWTLDSKLAWSTGHHAEVEVFE